MTIVPPRQERVDRNGAVGGPVAWQTPTTATAATGIARYAWVVARLGLGFIFLWAFVDKMFGFGYATKAGRGWLDGGNPTKGFLSGAKGPFAGFYQDIAGTGFANWAFMLGLLGIGVALLLGIGIRIAAVAGALLLTMMYTVVLPPTTNPVIDDHLILAVVLIGLAAVGAGNTAGLGRWWTSTPLVKRFPWLT